MNITVYFGAKLVMLGFILEKLQFIFIVNPVPELFQTHLFFPALFLDFKTCKILICFKSKAIGSISLNWIGDTHQFFSVYYAFYFIKYQF